jgi:hypothetical protein
MPRIRQKPPASSGGDKNQGKDLMNDTRPKTLDAGGKVTRISALAIFTSWFPLWPFHKQTAQQPVKPIPERRPHPMAAIKQGRKVAIIAVVDAGSPSFFRFGQGEFAEWPMAG